MKLRIVKFFSGFLHSSCAGESREVGVIWTGDLADLYGVSTVATVVTSYIIHSNITTHRFVRHVLVPYPYTQRVPTYVIFYKKNTNNRATFGNVKVRVDETNI